MSTPGILPELFLRNSYVYVSLRILESNPEFLWVMVLHRGPIRPYGFCIIIFYGPMVLHCASRVLESKFFMDPCFFYGPMVLHRGPRVLESDPS